jgi:NifU-like protein involved in Fe-S cluster formation
MARERYCAAVERHFRAPAHAGLPRGQGGTPARGEAGSVSRGTWVVFHARLEAGRILELTFQAYGCPHVIAACSQITAQLTGAPVAAGLAMAPDTLMRELEIPVQKHGSLLILQDALRNCLRDWDTTQPAARGRSF